MLVGTALEASYFIWEIPTGVLADTVSRRMSVIAGTAIVGVSWMGQGLVPVFVAIVGFEILRGLGEAFTHGAVEAWVAGECGDDGLDALFLRETQLRQIAGIVGLPVGIALATIDLRIPIVLGGGLILALAVLLVFVMPERHHPRRNEARTWRATVGTARRGITAVRTSALLVALLGAEFFWGAASEGWDRLSDAHLLLDLDFPPLGVTPVVGFGVLSLVTTILVIVTAQFVRRAVQRVDEQVVSRFLVALQVVRIACQAAFVLAPWSALASCRPVTRFSALLLSSLQRLLIRRPESLSATVLPPERGQLRGRSVSVLSPAARQRVRDTTWAPHDRRIGLTGNSLFARAIGLPARRGLHPAEPASAAL